MTTGWYAWHSHGDDLRHTHSVDLGDKHFPSDTLRHHGVEVVCCSTAGATSDLKERNHTSDCPGEVKAGVQPLMGLELMNERREKERYRLMYEKERREIDRLATWLRVRFPAMPQPEGPVDAVISTLGALETLVDAAVPVFQSIMSAWLSAGLAAGIVTQDDLDRWKGA
jgi:hypothetical protein